MTWNYRMIKVDQEGDQEIGMIAEVRLRASLKQALSLSVILR